MLINQFNNPTDDFYDENNSDELDNNSVSDQFESEEMVIAEIEAYNDIYNKNIVSFDPAQNELFKKNPLFLYKCYRLELIVLSCLVHKIPGYEIARRILNKEDFTGINRYIFQCLTNDLYVNQTDGSIDNIQTWINENFSLDNSQQDSLTEVCSYIRAHTNISADNFAKFLNNLIEHSKFRSVYYLTYNFFNDANFDNKNINGPLIPLDRFEKQINEIVNRSIQTDLDSIDKIADDFLTKINNLINAKKNNIYSTGYAGLDKYLSGLVPGNLVVIAARPGRGKTAFALNILYNIANELNEYKKAVKDDLDNYNLDDELNEDNDICLFYSIEMNSDEILARLGSLHSNVSFKLSTATQIYSSKTSSYQKFANGIKVLKDLPIYINSSPQTSIKTIYNDLHYLASINKIPKIIIVDYLQLINTHDLDAVKNRSRHEAIGFISGSLKRIAKQYNVPVIALAQLSRRIEERKGADAVPILSDLRESGSIEQDADIVMFIHSSTPNKKGQDVDTYEMEKKLDVVMHIAKNRSGPTGQVKFIFDKEHSKFEEDKD
ncbi:AAA family ATPase [Mycoplasma sp. T363T]|uniref:AAA family ATPase n=1 Tax=Mycoplasma bradburyae TaxID=2963128 RepID=A0ABT5GAK9_9MOLU|nr:DnaB-like helicase C-terminal domain-containing protein [Mycoplasma bradburyae]MDC4162984.1 AAA family ATPase [Mycoplasma bradburyae]MDC4181595.1 AAA family ATPase [Mycoplasma bradburyae]MDC4182321.1 AAA family ATPase [Mycoplasma bradburyae]UTS69982.1 AAA family ATPase [Mycoplasma bradburyae]